jgi:UDP-glucose 4-epimerase
MPVIIVTGSSGHLGESLMRVMRERSIECVGIDVLPSPSFTTHVGSIADKNFILPLFKSYEAETGIQGVINTAVLHKPHIVSHSMQQFVDVNITGTLTLLSCFHEAINTEATSKKIPFENRFFIQTSTTSTYGESLTSKTGSAITWIDESVAATPKNIYGVTKRSAEEICELFAKQHKIANVFVLQAARFFPEEDDEASRASQFASNFHQQFVELFHRRVEIEDLVDVHLLAAQKAASRKSEGDDKPKGIFKRYICSAPSPIPKDQNVLQRLAQVPANEVFSNDIVFFSEEKNDLWNEFSKLYSSTFGREIPVGTLDRVYCSDAAVRELGWTPKFTAQEVMKKLIQRKQAQSTSEEEDKNFDWRSNLAREIGKKGYHRK